MQNTKDQTCYNPSKWFANAPRFAFRALCVEFHTKTLPRPFFTKQRIILRILEVDRSIFMPTI